MDNYQGAEFVLRELSKLLDSEESTAVLAHLQALALLSQAEGKIGALSRYSTSAHKSNQIGLWERTSENGSFHFVRKSGSILEWRDWADVREFFIDEKKKRVVLLGESAARGYFYDPAITPAKILEGMLNVGHDEELIEIVDLAKTDATGSEIESLISHLHLVKPDAVVLFAGNNWYKVSLSLEDFLMLAQTLRSGNGYSEMSTIFRNIIMTSRAKATLDLLAQKCSQLKAHVVVIVPEYNLVDWQSEDAILIPALKGDLNAAWLKLYKVVLEALDEHGDYNSLCELAVQLRAIDKGTSWFAPWLLGQSQLKLGNRDEARNALEEAKDNICGIFAPHSPRCSGSIQRVLRDKSQEHGFDTVDLPKIFNRALQSGLADRRFFLDYCHLNLSGIKLAMAEAAHCLSSYFKLPTISVGELIEQSPTLSYELEAQAQFMAAIHNAHYGQKKELIQYHCRKALEISPTVKHVMTSYLDFHTRCAPTWMCSSYANLANSPIVKRYLLPIDPAMTDKFEDTYLINAIIEELRESKSDVQEHVTELMITERYGDSSEPVDLLSSFYSSRTFRSRIGYSMGNEWSHYRAYTLQSQFRMIAGGDQDVVLSLTCRLLGSGEVSDRIRIYVNHQEIAVIQAASDWNNFSIVVPKAKLLKGSNGILLNWPIRTINTNLELERAVSRLERCLIPDSLPAYGEIYSFTMAVLPSHSQQHIVESLIYKAE